MVRLRGMSSSESVKKSGLSGALASFSLASQDELRLRALVELETEALEARPVELEARPVELEARPVELDARTAEPGSVAPKPAVELQLLVFLTTLFSLLLSRLFRRAKVSSVLFLFEVPDVPLGPARDDGRASAVALSFWDSIASSLRDFPPFPPDRDDEDLG